MKSIRYLMVLAFMLFAVANATVSSNPPNIAQAQDAWSLTVFSGGDEINLFVVDDTGILDTIPVSNEAQPPYFYETSAVFASSNDRYIVHIADDGFEQFVYFGETGDGPCCFELHEQLGFVETFQISSFEPQGSRFAFSIWTDVDGTLENRIGIMDATTGELSGPLTALDEISAIIDIDPDTSNLFLGDWTAQGILFLPVCYGCEGWSNEYMLWQPDSQSFMLRSGVYYSSSQVDLLDVTGEAVAPATDGAYKPDFNLRTNVIKYYDNPDIENSSGTVVYANLEDTNYAGPVHWVGDGQAILVEDKDTEMWDIVYRDGRTASVEAFNYAAFVGGSPTGWYGSLLGDDSFDYALYHYDMETLEPTLIVDSFEETATSVVRSPVLGNSVTELTFPRFEPTWYCPNAIAPRLTVGQNGRITPTYITLIHADPYIVSEIVGEIATVEPEFLVLEGPHCDELNSTFWWRVEFEGAEGWIVESDDELYLVEPVE